MAAGNRTDTLEPDIPPHRALIRLPLLVARGDGEPGEPPGEAQQSNGADPSGGRLEPHGGMNMRKLTVLVLALGMLAAMALSATAGGVITLTATPNPVVAGNNVAVEATTTQFVPKNQTDLSWGNNLTLYICYTLDGTGIPTTEPAASASCESPGEPAEFGWVQKDQADPEEGLSYTLATTGLAGRTVGLLVEHDPVQGISGSRAFANVDVTAPAVVTERHAGCNGIDKAVAKVKPGGKAQKQLDDLSEKFNCSEE
jgi:hypothetical protein